MCCGRRLVLVAREWPQCAGGLSGCRNNGDCVEVEGARCGAG